MIEHFLTYLRTEKRYSELTVRAYGEDIRQFARFCLSAGGEVVSHESQGHLDALSPSALGEENTPREEERFDPTRVETDDLRAWIMHLNGTQGRSATTINRKISALKSFYRFLRKRGEMEEDPFQKITNLKTPRRLPVFVEQSRMERIVASLTLPSEEFIIERDALIVLLLYATGMRLAELIGVRLSDFSQHYTLLRVRGKGDKERIIPVVGPIAAKIAHYIALIKSRNSCESGNNFLLLAQDGGPISRTEVSRVVRGVLQSAGVQGKSSPHVLRHTFATHLLNSGADIRVIQELLGHSSLGATQIYTHNSIERLKQAYQNAHPRARIITKKED